MPRLSPDEIAAICRQELDSALSAGDLSEERSDALERYLGEPMGTEIEGRSQVVTREVLETVEWIKPSLCRIFCDAENIVEFEPVGPEDEEQARQESDVVSHIYWKQNRGFYNTYTAITDALLSKTGILKVWYEPPSEREELEEYSGLSEQDLALLLSDATMEREIDGDIELDETTGTMSLRMRARRATGRIRVEPVAPEDFFISSSASSPYAKDALFCGQRSRKSISELVEMGFDRNQVESLAGDAIPDTRERLARRHLSDEDDIARSDRLRQIWVAECYIRIDADDDGIAELKRVWLADGAASRDLLRIDGRPAVEDVDRIPFATASPVLLTHKFYGLSIADLVTDLQEIRTTLLRQVLDNTYLANNGRTIVNDDAVNLDDVLESRPQGVIRYSGDGPPGQYIERFSHAELPRQTYELFGMLDEMRKQRTGVGDEVAGLDKAALAQVNTGVAALAFDAARMKIELVARVLGEVLFRPVFADIRELAQKHIDRPMVVRLRGEWVQVDPSGWRDRPDTTVRVGTGTPSRERKLMALDAVITRQKEVMEAGGIGTFLMPENIYRALADWTKLLGVEPSLYWTDPAEAPPPAPEQPSIQEQAIAAQIQALGARTELDQMKLQIDAQRQARELELREQEIAARRELKALEMRLDAVRADAQHDTQIASLEQQRERQQLESAMKGLAQQLDHIKAERDRELELYQTQMKSYLELMAARGITVDGEQERMRREQQIAEQLQSVVAERDQSARIIADLQASVVDLMERLTGTSAALEEARREIAEARAPKQIERDEQGRIISIGGVPVVRDESGMVVSIGG